MRGNKFMVGGAKCALNQFNLFDRLISSSVSSTLLLVPSADFTWSCHDHVRHGGVSAELSLLYHDTSEWIRCY